MTADDPDRPESSSKARAYPLIADQLRRSVVAAGVDIEDLCVAFADGAASITGVTKTPEDRERAAVVLAKHPDVRKVSNGIVVVGPTR